MTKVLDDGFVSLVDSMGSDQSIVQAARVSYNGVGDEDRTESQDRNLIRYLMRNHHTSPFEMAELQFHIKAPIFVARQWMRHRTASINEISGRYTELDMGHWQPKEWRGQDTANKQSSEGVSNYKYPHKFNLGYPTAEGHAEAEYRFRLHNGVSRELARTCLPVSTWTEWVWKIDLHNLLHFLRLRMDSHAQPEIRVYAETIAEEDKEKFPVTWEAFVDYRLEAKTFSRQEMEVLQGLVGKNMGYHDVGAGKFRESSMSVSEKRDFLNKLFNLPEETIKEMSNA